jgi:hypothetical protein
VASPVQRRKGDSRAPYAFHDFVAFRKVRRGARARRS